MSQHPGADSWQPRSGAYDTPRQPAGCLPNRQPWVQADKPGQPVCCAHLHVATAASPPFRQLAGCCSCRLTFACSALVSMSSGKLKSSADCCRAACPDPEGPRDRGGGSSCSRSLSTSSKSSVPCTGATKQPLKLPAQGRHGRPASVHCWAESVTSRERCLLGCTASALPRD